MMNDEEWHVFKCGAEDMCECRGNSANEKKKKRGKIGKRDLRERERDKNYKKENEKKMVECRWSGPTRA